MALTNPRSRRRFGQTIIANLIGCAVLIVGAFTSPVLVGLGFTILVVSLAVRLYAIVILNRRRYHDAET